MGTNNIDNEDEELFVTITLEDDSEIECEVLTIFEVEEHYFMIMEKKMEKYLFIDILKTKMESLDLTILKHRKNLTWFQKCLTVLLKTENMTKLSRNNI
mgnify:CR=1 FL=1